MKTNTEGVDRLTEEVHKLKKTIRYLKSITKQFTSDGSINSRTQEIIESNASDGVSVGIAYRTSCNLEQAATQLTNDVQQLIETITIEIDELKKDLI